MKKNIPLIILLVFLLTACSSLVEKINNSEDVGPTPTFETLANGLGGIVGTLETVNSSSTQNLKVFAAPYLGDPEGEGVYFYEEKMENTTHINEDGFFQISNLSPGYYILLFGPDIDLAEAYQSQGKAIKVKVSANKFTDIGKIQ
ncbi:MAG: hypothetical protein SVR94_12960 [Pseudomonadota bacterium]|nr:hypothetical protein [Pseudomonadota bacterium]